MSKKTKLEAVLAEQWEASPFPWWTRMGPSVKMPDAPSVAHIRDADERDKAYIAHIDARAAVAVLGKRALALILKYEWSGDVLTDDDHLDCCPECRGLKADGPFNEEEPMLRHRPWCELGAVCDEARRLG